MRRRGAEPRGGARCRPMVLAFLLPRLRRLQPGLAMSTATGTFSLQQPLNYRAGGRVQPVDGGQTEDVYEPATGTCRPELLRG